MTIKDKDVVDSLYVKSLIEAGGVDAIVLRNDDTHEFLHWKIMVCYGDGEKVAEVQLGGVMTNCFMGLDAALQVVRFMGWMKVVSIESADGN